ncbi:methylated-DNA--[protein]-cysteine S-methyltransferase [bacterium]|nr:methylated-DNA--[protein]-cysteine S-methyltransferase [bacterium]
MTFQCYLRTLRLGQAFGRIRYGEKVIEAAYNSGYESLSGFGESFRNIIGFSPRDSVVQKLIVITRLTTSLGPMLAGVVDDRLCLLEFVGRRMLETQMKRLNSRLNARCMPGQHPLFNELNRQLQAYFDSRLKIFDLPLILPGTDFQKMTWQGLMQIPYGETRSYQEQAAFIGRPKAVRAVASANGDNRIGIIIPCHRVIGKDGKLAGYGGGLWRKKRLLELERSHQA